MGKNLPYTISLFIGGSRNRVSRALKLNYATVEDYVNYLRQVYMFFELRNFGSRHGMQKIRS